MEKRVMKNILAGVLAIFAANTGFATSFFNYNEDHSVWDFRISHSRLDSELLFCLPTGHYPYLIDDGWIRFSRGRRSPEEWIVFQWGQSLDEWLEIYEHVGVDYSTSDPEELLGYSMIVRSPPHLPALYYIAIDIGGEGVLLIHHDNENIREVASSILTDRSCAE